MKFPAATLARHLAALANVQRLLRRWWPPATESETERAPRGTPAARREIASIRAFLDSGLPPTPEAIADCRRRIAMYAARRAPTAQSELNLEPSRRG